MSWDCIVIGGGCAGLAAATNLAHNRRKVLVLDRRRILGGRVSSFYDHVSGEELDNGQHLFLGCYTETRKYLHRIGGASALKFFPDLSTKLFGPDGEMVELRRAALPAPFNLAWGFMRFRALSILDRLRIFGIILDAKRFPGKLRELTVTEWLDRYGLSAMSRERFWEPLTLSTLNVPMDRAPADLLAVVLRRGFLGTREDAAYGLSITDLSNLHGEPSQTYLEARGGEVLSRASVKRVVRKDQVVEVELHNGRTYDAKTVLCAVPPDSLPKFFRDDAQMHSHVSPAATFEPSPILTLHVWCDSEPFTDLMVGFWGQTFHWAFNRKQIVEASGGPASRFQHLSLVISGAEEEFGWSKDRLVKEAEKSLSLVAKRRIRVLRAVNSIERGATWGPEDPKDSMARLSSVTPDARVFLAGDWTDTGLPCTIEGAVFSGHRAASLIEGFLSSRLSLDMEPSPLPEKSLAVGGIH